MALPATAFAVFVENKDDRLNIMCHATHGERTEREREDNLQFPEQIVWTRMGTGWEKIWLFIYPSLSLSMYTPLTVCQLDALCWKSLAVGRSHEGKVLLTPLSLLFPPPFLPPSLLHPPSFPTFSGFPHLLAVPLFPLAVPPLSTSNMAPAHSLHLTTHCNYPSGYVRHPRDAPEPNIVTR